MGVASLLYLGDTISQLLPGCLAHTMVLPHLLPGSLRLRCRSHVVDISDVSGCPHRLLFWPVKVFCKGLHPLQKETSLMRGDSYSHLWVQLWISSVQQLPLQKQQMVTLMPKEPTDAFPLPLSPQASEVTPNILERKKRATTFLSDCSRALERRLPLCFDCWHHWMQWICSRSSVCRGWGNSHCRLLIQKKGNAVPPAEPWHVSWQPWGSESRENQSSLWTIFPLKQLYSICILVTTARESQENLIRVSWET